MDSLEKRTMDKVTWRLVPFLIVCYFIAYLDRVNFGFAGAAMSKDLGLTATAFGTAAGMFFISYFIFEVPSNLALDRFGARVWIARIMFTWGLISGAMAFVQGETSINIVRILLGIAEAGFFPGIIFFLTLWFPATYRARIIGWFMFAIPISIVIGSPISGMILGMEGYMGLHGWQWMFIIEAAPALILTFVVLGYLTDRPSQAKWLTSEESAWLQARLDAERAQREKLSPIEWKQSILNPRVIALGLVYMGLVTPLYGLTFFLPQIVKAFGGPGGLGNIQVGFITAIPYAFGAVTMVLWSRHSDKTSERVWHTIIPALAIVVGLVSAAFVTDPSVKIACLCIGAFGFFASLPVFWTFPTALLSGTAAAAGIAVVNSIGNLGGYLGPQVFGLLKDRTGTELYGLLFLASLGAMAAIIVVALGHNPALERASPQPGE